MHVNIFVTNCHKDISSINQIRLYDALKQLKHFKNDKLINKVKNAVYGK